MSDLARLLDEIVEQTSIPSVSMVVRVDGAEVFHHTTGLARLVPPTHATADQAYDLASLTKALVTVPVVASLLADGRLELDAPVSTVLPEVAPRITLAHLLTHSAGYPAHVKFYEGREGTWGTVPFWTGILRDAQRTPLEAEPGVRHRYSDVGFLVLLALLRVAGERELDVQFHERVLKPTGLLDLRFGWPEAAATEDCPLRGHVVQGTVHDPNCAAMGGVSTHAGLFGTARAVAGLAETMMDAASHRRDSALPGQALETLFSLEGPGSHRGGVDTISPGYSSTGSHFPADTLGHLGYTGTSVWWTESRRTVVAFLTNRIHPVDDLTDIRAVRPRVHDAVAHALGWT